MIEIEVVGADKVIARLAMLPGKVEAGAGRGLLRLGLKKRAVEKVSGPVLRVRTGRGRASIYEELRAAPGEVALAVGTPLPYMAAQERGVPHSWTIAASRARALSFDWQGRHWLLRSVMHGPLPARSFLASSLAELAPQAPELIAAELERELRA